jgi:hypothetical protein
VSQAHRAVKIVLRLHRFIRTVDCANLAKLCLHLPESDNSSPRSHEINSEIAGHHQSSDDVFAHSAIVAGRVKLILSYGDEIQPKPHDNQLAFVCDSNNVCITYQFLGLSPLLTSPFFHLATTLLYYLRHPRSLFATVVVSITNIPDLHLPFPIEKIGHAMEEDMWHTETSSDGLEI